VVNICDLAYTTNARRGNDIFRAAFVSSSADELLEMIKVDVGTDTKRTSEGAGTVFLFTGQGAQYAGMGRVLFKTCKEFRERIEFCDKQATWLGFPSFIDLITDPNVDIASRSAVENQLAIVSLEVALATSWNSWGVVPAVVVGHSLGEYSALCVAGVLSITDMLYLVGHRASLVEEHCVRGAYQMLSVKVGVDEIRSKLSNKLEISCINTPTATVVSGKTEDIKVFQSELEQSGVRADLLKNAFGFHSSQMDPVLQRFDSLAQSVVFSKPLVPVASTLNGSIVRESGTFSASYLAGQMRKPVNFVGALKSAQESKCINDQTLWLELGPGPVCLGLAAAFLDIPATRQMVSLRQREDNSKTIATAMRAAYMAGLSINWAAFYAEHIDTLNILPLPMYAFDVKEYWTPYRTPKTVHLSDSDHQSGAALLEPKLVGFPTTTLQSVEKEERSPSKISVVFASRLTEPNLMAVMQGHVVSGKAICPSSIFADMACTAARYIYQRIHPGKPQRATSLESLDITNPLTVSGLDSDKIVRVTAVASSSADWAVQISFSSIDNLKSQSHGSCHVKFEDEAEWTEEWDKTSYLVRSRMESMFEAAKTGKAQRLSRRFVYKLFNNVVHYSEPYQGLSEVILGGQEDDAVAIVNFKSLPAGSKFTWAPYWTDPLVHLAGFVLNGNADTPDDIAYLSAGLKSFRVAGELSETKTYFSYVRMRQSRQKGILTGDVYVFEGQKVVAVAAGLMFQKMPKNVLHAILGVSGSNSSVAQHPKAPAPKTHSEPNEKVGVDDLYYDSTPSGANTPWYSSGSDTDESAATSHMGIDAEDIFNQCLSAIAKETGYPTESMNDDTVFDDMGVDSLMSVAIIDTIKKTSGITVPAAFFTVHPTVGAMRRALDDLVELDAPMSSEIVEAGEKKAPSMKSVSISETPVAAPAFPIGKTEAVVASESSSVVVVESSAPRITPVKVVAEGPKQEFTPPQPKKQYSSNVVLLQGRPLSGKTPLFLLVDGAGSSTAYMHLPFFPTNLPVYALESPFLHCPLEYTISIHEIALLFVEAIRKTRPKGPYMMGGWSAGSVYAYEASRILLEAGETISGLVLLDMRVPRPMPDGMELTMEIVEQVGLFTGIQRAGRAIASVSDKLRQHLLSTVKQLMAFKALPMPQGKRPLKTVIIWARKGMIDVIKEQGLEIPEWAKDIDQELEGNVMEDESLGLAAWFYGKRTNFGANGWDELLGDVDTHVVEGADHFSLVSPPCVKTTGKFMQEAVAAFTSLENSASAVQGG
jgi:iterative type I PKS product template protein